MGYEDEFDDLRQKASFQARIAAELGRGLKALRNLRFRTAARHLRNALELSPDDRHIRRSLLFARFASWFQYVVLVLLVAGLGFLGFMIATQWAPAFLAARQAPTLTPRPSPTPTWTRVIPTAVPTATRRPTPRFVPTSTLQPAPTPRNITLEVLDSKLAGRQMLVEVKVFEAGTSVFGLRRSDFELTSDNSSIPFFLEERNADDPVCLVVVIDDSGSILPGLEQIRAAVRGLNDKRKLGDELGMVVFAGSDRVEVKQLPADSPLDEMLVTGQGQRTALWDGVLKGIEVARSCSMSTRYLLVFTDGADNSSVKLQGDDSERALLIANLAEAQGLGVCTVGVESEALKEEPLILAAHRCRYSRAAAFDELTALFEDLFGYVRHFYRLEFSTDHVPPESESVTLRVLRAAAAVIDVEQ
jgi:hypothetical protein